MSDNHDLLNDNDMCSFSGHEAEDMCFNCGDHTYGMCLFIITEISGFTRIFVICSVYLPIERIKGLPYAGGSFLVKNSYLKGNENIKILIGKVFTLI